jgi:Ala-tRNA(Pro) deacylase
MDPALKKYLENHSIKYQIYNHPAVFTVAEAKAIKEKFPAQHAKCLFLKDDKGKFYLVGMKADKRLDTKALRKYLHVEKLHFASPEELKQELNLTPGSVSIFGMIYSKNTILLIDKEVWEAKAVGFHPNINTATLVIDNENLKRYCNSLNCKKEVIEIG